MYSKRGGKRGAFHQGCERHFTDAVNNMQSFIIDDTDWTPSEMVDNSAILW
jgi:hypothetical protein